MFECQNSGGWVDELWETPDPDEVFASLEKLIGWTGTVYDAAWRFFLEVDPHELRDGREIQKTQLCRYLRINIFDLEHADIPWIRERMRYLDRVLQMENEASRTTEND